MLYYRSLLPLVTIVGGLTLSAQQETVETTIVVVSTITKWGTPFKTGAFLLQAGGPATPTFSGAGTKPTSTYSSEVSNPVREPFGWFTFRGPFSNSTVSPIVNRKSMAFTRTQGRALATGGAVAKSTLTSSPMVTRAATAGRLTPSATTATSAPSATHTVSVGAQGRLLFEPKSVNAAVGDVILFKFLQSNHTVTQSSRESPCEPSNGFDSGFSYYNPKNQTNIINQQLLYLVRDSQPTWFFCRQNIDQNHCHAGMVFGLNIGQQIANFAENAMGGEASSKIQIRDLLGNFSYTSSATRSITVSPGHFPFRVPLSVQAFLSIAVSGHVRLWSIFAALVLQIIFFL